MFFEYTLPRRNTVTFFRIVDLNLSFGGLRVTDNVNLEIKQGEITAIIGPNGAGKTTLFNLISGYLKPDSGEIIFLNEKITRMVPKKITKKGIARSFQIVNIFPNFSVYENIMIPILSEHQHAYNLFKSAKNMVRDECHYLIKSIGLDDKMNLIAGELSHGNQKRLEVGIALALKPKLLLLDEPTSGMATEEKEGILTTIKTLIKKQNCTVFLCEHDMNVIFSLSDSIWCLANGSIVASGNPDQIKNNETVRKIYLGEDK
jgi:branched-chain amino acid transport system ATP-binding protein